MFYGLHQINILYNIEKSNLPLINLYLIIHLPAKFLFPCSIDSPKFKHNMISLKFIDGIKFVYIFRRKFTSTRLTNSDMKFPTMNCKPKYLSEIHFRMYLFYKNVNANVI